MLSYEFPFENWMICPLAGMGKCFSQSTFKSTEFGLNSTTSNLPNAIMVDWNYWQTHFGIYIGSSYTFSEILPNRKINFGLKYLNSQNVLWENPINSNGQEIEGINGFNSQFNSLAFVLGFPIANFPILFWLNSYYLR